MSIDSIYERYRVGLLSAEAAARAILGLGGEPRDTFFDVRPSTRPLLAALHRLRTGQESNLFLPDPARHTRWRPDLLEDHPQRTWANVQGRGPFRYAAFFGAESHTVAERLRIWAQMRADLDVTVTTPEQADSDDWELKLITRNTVASLEFLTQWFDWLRQAPTESQATLHGLSVVDPSDDTSAA